MTLGVGQVKFNYYSSNIDQVINYKPIERKIILEDSWYIGLRQRRRIRLKLQSTDINLEKVQINLDNLFDQKKFIETG